jgi:hypothetical protein
MRFQPQCPSRERRIHASFPPPTSLVAATVGFAMVSSAQGDGELIADLPAKRAALGKSQVMSVGWLPPADQARVLGD